MKKILLSILAVAVVAVALGTAGFVYAQTSAPRTPGTGTGYGAGMMGGRGGSMAGMMGQGTGSGDQDGWMHDSMIAYFAQSLGISVDDLNARLANGETMAQIAVSKGLTTDQFIAWMTAARNQAIDQAVKDGTLTQAQADWMKQHSSGMSTRMGGMMRGAGQGQNGNWGCPYFSQSQP